MNVVTTLLIILKIWNFKFKKLIQSSFEILKLSKVFYHIQMGSKKTKSLKTSSQIATIAYNLNIIYYHILTIAKFD